MILGIQCKSQRHGGVRVCGMKEWRKKEAKVDNLRNVDFNEEKPK